MKNMFLIMIVAMIVFLIYKGFLVLASKLVKLIFKVTGEEKSKFDLGISVAVQTLFLGIWVICMDIVNQRYGLSSIIFYVSFCLVGVFCVIWCYFSWDVEHIFIKPCIACEEHRRIKKIVIYTLILVFVLCQGYFQTLHAFDKTIEINALFSVTNYSVIVATIALDRVMNQIIK